MVIPCLDFTAGPSTPFVWTTSMMASIYPAVWSFQLALRGRGLGSVLTTAHLLDDSGVRALLEIPANYTADVSRPRRPHARHRFSPGRPPPARRGHRMGPLRPRERRVAFRGQIP